MMPVSRTDASFLQHCWLLHNKNKHFRKPHCPARTAASTGRNTIENFQQIFGVFKKKVFVLTPVLPVATGAVMFLRTCSSQPSWLTSSSSSSCIIILYFSRFLESIRWLGAKISAGRCCATSPRRNNLLEPLQTDFREAAGSYRYRSQRLFWLSRRLVTSGGGSGNPPTSSRPPPPLPLYSSSLYRLVFSWLEQFFEFILF